MRGECCDKEYPKNMCAWSWLKRQWYPFAWADAENKARSLEWRLRCIEARLDQKEIPSPPNRIWMR